MKNNVITKSKTKNVMSKNLILIAIAIFALQTATAQRPDWINKDGGRPEHVNFMQDFTAEQMATLQTKKMSLKLDLTENQISKVYDINLKAAKARESKMAEMKNKKEQGKPSAEERYNMMIGRLDTRIEYKKELAKVLTKEQLEKWSILASEYFGKTKHFMVGKPNFASGNN